MNTALKQSPFALLEPLAMSYRKTRWTQVLGHRVRLETVSRRKLCTAWQSRFGLAGSSISHKRRSLCQTFQSRDPSRFPESAEVARRLQQVGICFSLAPTVQVRLVSEHGWTCVPLIKLGCLGSPRKSRWRGRES